MIVTRIQFKFPLEKRVTEENICEEKDCAE